MLDIDEMDVPQQQDDPVEVDEEAVEPEEPFSREELLEQAGSLATDPDIFERVGREATRTGFAGSTEVVQLTVCALTSRVMAEPTSVVLSGPSSAGKSFAIKTALRFVPPEAYVLYTSASEKSLYYSDDDLRHRFVVFNELGGLVGEHLVEAMKSLLSEAELRYQVTVPKEGGGFTVQHIHRPGPSGLLSTTVEGIDGELATRCVMPVVPDDPDQTRAVMLMHASGASPADVDFRPYHALQRLIALDPLPRVVVPFAQQLAEKIDPRPVRIRRDHMHIVSLIQACAVLHGENRGRDAEGRIEADLDDYRMVHRFAASVVEETAGSGVPPSLREAVEALSDAYPRTAVEVATVLGVDRTTATRRLNQAHKWGYVRFEQSHGGAQKKWFRADPMEGDTPVLPDPDDLA